jgi:hypothetical protein
MAIRSDRFGLANSASTSVPSTAHASVSRRTHVPSAVFMFACLCAWVCMGVTCARVCVCVCVSVGGGDARGDVASVRVASHGAMRPRR